MWKRGYESEIASGYEREILHAVFLSEIATKQGDVGAGRKLCAVVKKQTGEVERVVGETGENVLRCRAVAQGLAGVRDGVYERLLRVEKEVGVVEGVESRWCERVWDLEGCVVERRYEMCVEMVERLREDGIEMGSTGNRVRGRFKGLVDRIVGDLCGLCGRGDVEMGIVYAPLLGRLGRGDEGRRRILCMARDDLVEELRVYGGRMYARVIAAILDATLKVLRRTYEIYRRIGGGGCSASWFVAWAVQTADEVYVMFVRPVLSKAKKADAGTILACVQATRSRRRDVDGDGECKSVEAILDTRVTTHVRAEVEVFVREAERQLMGRARMYASGLPRDWSDAPYQSGRAVCDELNDVARGVEAALCGLGTETDVLVAGLLVKPGLTYCAELLELGTKSLCEGGMQAGDVQAGILKTVQLVGKCVLRLHHRFDKVPMLERVGRILCMGTLGEIRIMMGGILVRKAEEERNDVCVRMVLQDGPGMLGGDRCGAVSEEARQVLACLRARAETGVA